MEDEELKPDVLARIKLFRKKADALWDEFIEELEAIERDTEAEFAETKLLPPVPSEPPVDEVREWARQLKPSLKAAFKSPNRVECTAALNVSALGDRLRTEKRMDYVQSLEFLNRVWGFFNAPKEEAEQNWRKVKNRPEPQNCPHPMEARSTNGRHLRCRLCQGRYNRTTATWVYAGWKPLVRPLQPESSAIPEDPKKTFPPFPLKDDQYHG